MGIIGYYPRDHKSATIRQPRPEIAGAQNLSLGIREAAWELAIRDGGMKPATWTVHLVTKTSRAPFVYRNGARDEFILY
jgi:hypothetical protein